MCNFFNDKFFYFTGRNLFIFSKFVKCMTEIEQV